MRTSQSTRAASLSVHLLSRISPDGAGRLIVSAIAAIRKVRGMANGGHKEVLVARIALIVDDSASIRQMVSFTLSEAGFGVLEESTEATRCRCVEKRQAARVLPWKPI